MDVEKLVKWLKVSGKLMTMKKLICFSLMLWVAMVLSPVSAAPVVIIKADDFRGPSQTWTNFLDVSRKAGIKVSIGVIADSIAGDEAASAWMKAQVARQDVEFWDHGWDHKELGMLKAGPITEFGGSGLTYQREHLAKAQATLKAALGNDVAVFGTPYNAFDVNTARVINETPELRLIFTHNPAARKL